MHLCTCVAAGVAMLGGLLGIVCLHKNTHEFFVQPCSVVG
jgi:hypothetical protein